MDPDEEKIFMIDAYKHRVNAVCKRELVIMRSDAKLGVRVYVDVANIYFVLMIVNVVYLRFIVGYFGFIYFQVHFIFLFLLLSPFKVCYALPAHFVFLYDRFFGALALLSE